MHLLILFIFFLLGLVNSCGGGSGTSLRNATSSTSDDDGSDPDSALNLKAVALVNEALSGFINLADSAEENTLVQANEDSRYIARYKVVTSETNCDASLSYGALPLNNSSDLKSASS